MLDTKDLLSLLPAVKKIGGVAAARVEKLQLDRLVLSGRNTTECHQGGSKNKRPQPNHGIPPVVLFASFYKSTVTLPGLRPRSHPDFQPQEP